MTDIKTTSFDIVLIGGGIMSATMATLLQSIRPDWSIALYERADQVATESSGDWNNSGTGHAGLCELNYTPEQKDGSIATTTATKVNGQFRETLAFWSHLVERGKVKDASSFISTVPHMSYVIGEEDVDFLRKRYDALTRLPAYRDLEYSDDPDQLAEWAPLMFHGRNVSEPVAMTRAKNGTDVNFGAITRELVNAASEAGMTQFLGHQVTDLQRTGSGWTITVENRKTHEKSNVQAKFVFVGAGGASIHLLQKANIPEAKGYGGFPVSGMFLSCTNPEVIKEHQAKVYGKPQLNAPPMSMPHLDTRWVNGEQVLLFGPFAGFKPKFLQQGSMLDLPKSIKLSNLKTYLDVGIREFGLTKYLIGQLMLRHSQRIEVLDDFMPSANGDDWTLNDAGMRVQTLKRGADGRGKLEFGTEVVATADGTMAGLLGASPGASASVSIVLQILSQCFPAEFADGMNNELGGIFPMRALGTDDVETAIIETEKHIQSVLGIGSNRSMVAAD